MNARTLILLIAGWPAAASAARADDWPQWRGVHRDGISKETGLLKSWPKDGPKLLWKITTIGGGYSTPTVVGERVYLMGDKKDQEYLMSLDAKTGKEVWCISVGKIGANPKGLNYPGPRSTPTVDGDLIYILGSDGDLVCVESCKGDIKWKKNLKTDFAGEVGKWAYAESPLIDGDVLVCTPGGKEATLAALNKKTGETIWKAAVPEGDAAAYASVIAVDVGGGRQYVQFVANGVVGVDAKSGKFLWRYNKTKDQAATIPTPIFHDDCVFTSTSRNGSGLIRVKPDAAEEIYYNKTSLNSIGTPVRIGDYLYATDGRGDLVCMEFKTGEVKWRNPSVGTASLCYADGLLYVRGQGGTGFGPEKPVFVALVEATPDGYKERGRFEQPDHGNKPAWPHPVIANGRLYLRDQSALFCYDVKGQ
jgi:outer membrane protein assembly factor BamB